MDGEFCTYLTVYKGCVLPRRYIGSTSVTRIKAGYRGSVKSKRYKEIFKSELSAKPHLFRTRILSRHSTHEEAIEFELCLHRKYDVVKSDKYINQSLACPKGFFGKSQFGKSHPFYGKAHTEETKHKVSEGVKLAYKEGRLKSPFSTGDICFKGELNPFFGKTHTDETKEKMRKPKRFVPRFICPVCNKENLDGGNFHQHVIRKHNWTREQVAQHKAGVGTDVSGRTEAL